VSIVMIQSNPEAGPACDLPAWMRRAAIDEATGTVFVPPGLADRGEREATLCAAWDGNVPCVIDDGHAYLPADWLAREAKDPKCAEACRFVAARVRDAYRSGGGCR
jgi:hypothetical protein